jgi:Ca2+-binding RTX toxin-like protein
MNGGTGTDTADYSQSATGVHVDLGLGQATGEGTDTIADVESVLGSAQSDELIASPTGSTLDGAQGSDTVTGGASADVLRAGNDFYTDTLEGRGGADSLDFGSAPYYDTVSYQHAPSAVTVELSLSTVSGGDGADLFVTTPGHVIGSSFNDHIVGDGNQNQLRGGPGSDTIEGQASNDDIYPGRGVDTIDGGTETDTLHYDDSTPTSGVTVDLANGTVMGGSGSDIVSAIENVVGSSFGDNLKGDALNNSLYGLAGDDTLTGRDGDDYLDGGDGTGDTIIGGNGTDNCTNGEFNTSCP